MLEENPYYIHLQKLIKLKDYYKELDIKCDCEDWTCNLKRIWLLLDAEIDSLKNKIYFELGKAVYEQKRVK